MFPLPPPEPTPLHTRTLDAFIGHMPDYVARSNDPWVMTFSVSNPWPSLSMDAQDLLDSGYEPKACRVPGYSIFSYCISNDIGFVAILDDRTGQAIAGIVNDAFYVYPEHRGKGLGTELLIEAYATGVKTIETEGKRKHSLTDDGRRAYVSAHRHAVERAIEQGMHVPAEVLAERTPENRLSFAL